MISSCNLGLALNHHSSPERILTTNLSMVDFTLRKVGTINNLIARMKVFQLIRDIKMSATGSRRESLQQTSLGPVLKKHHDLSPSTTYTQVGRNVRLKTSFHSFQNSRGDGLVVGCKVTMKIGLTIGHCQFEEPRS